MAPKVTVLMTVYNCEKYLRDAITSVLNQTYKDFEFLIINDASKDSSSEIINLYKDNRIAVVNNRKNIGLAGSLNKGIKLARGKYIARMDADDICYPERLERQVKYMDKNTFIGICGTYIKMITGKKNHIIKYPLDHEAIRCRLFIDSAIAHPSVIIRKKILKEHDLYYDPYFKHSQDLDLWVRAGEYIKFANIDRVLLKYRVHDEQISIGKSDKQIGYSSEILLRQLKRLGINPTEREFKLHKDIFFYNISPCIDSLEMVNDWLVKIIKQNEKKQVYSVIVFSQVIGSKWYRICSLANESGPAVWKLFRSSLLFKFLKQKKIKCAVLFFKCLIRMNSVKKKLKFFFGR